MKAAFMKDVREIVLRDVSARSPGPQQIRLKVTACGICGTDILAARNGEPLCKPFGHEIAGTIAELGAGVTQLEVGQKIVLDSATPCGRCAMCKNARQELCLDIQSFFFLDSFGMAEEMIAPAISAIPCEDLDPAVASLQEPLGVAIDVVRVADIQPGQNVLVMGPGPIGLMAVRLIKLAGANRIFVSALSGTTRRNALAREFGADEVIEVDRVPLDKYRFGCDIQRVVSTTPPATLPGVIPVVAKGAIIAYIGLAENEAVTMNFPANPFHFKKLQLRASFASPALFGPQALELLRSGRIDGPRLVSHRFPLSEVRQALALAVHDQVNTLKIVVCP